MPAAQQYGPLLLSFIGVGTLAAFLALMHIFLYFRHPRKEQPETLSFLWLGLLCLCVALHSYASFQRLQTLDSTQYASWMDWRWISDLLLLVFGTFYYYSLLNRWPDLAGRLLIGACALLLLPMILISDFMRPDGVLQPILYTTPWKESIYTSSMSLSPVYILAATLAFSSLAIGLRTGFKLFRIARTRTQGVILLFACTIIIITLIINILADTQLFPPILFLDHALSLHVLAMTIAVTDSVFIGKRATQRFEDLRDRLHHLILLVPGAPYQIFVSEQNQIKVLFLSPRIKDIFGIDPEPLQEAIQRFIASIIPEDRAAWIEAMRTTRDTSSHFNVTGRLENPTQGILWFRAQSNPMKVPGGTVHSGILIDVTEERKAEAEKSALLHELNLRNAELESIM